MQPWINHSKPTWQIQSSRSRVLVFVLMAKPIRQHHGIGSDCEPDKNRMYMYVMTTTEDNVRANRPGKFVRPPFRRRTVMALKLPCTRSLPETFSIYMNWRKLIWKRTSQSWPFCWQWKGNGKVDMYCMVINIRKRHVCKDPYGRCCTIVCRHCLCMRVLIPRSVALT